MLGTDNSALASRAGDMHSDSIMLLRTDPSHHRLYYLSIPRDLEVPIPGHGTQKINAAFQIGGTELAHPDDPRVHEPAGEPRDRRQLRRLQGADRRARRDRRERAEADPVEPVRLPLRDAGAVRQVAGLAVREGQPAHERRARADLLAHPRERARPIGDGLHARRAAAGRDRRGHLEARVVRDVPEGAVQGQLVREAARDGPLDQPARRARLGEVPRIGLELSALPARRRLRRRRHGLRRARTIPTTLAMFLGKSAPQPPTGQFDPGCVVGHPLQ